MEYDLPLTRTHISQRVLRLEITLLITAWVSLVVLLDLPAMQSSGHLHLSEEDVYGQYGSSKESHKFSIELRSGTHEFAGQGIRLMSSLSRNSSTRFA
ncbi:hypothetical protein TNCV_3168671 [Trichonephila clavipes]|nr:hypothetical protein TNCV_3168671 [Trichonephila clavipes]